VLVEAMILLSINRTLKGIDKAPTVAVLNGIGSFGKKKNLWIPAGIITAVSVFMMLVPLNLSSTLKAPEFVTYMGIGSGQIRIDVRQTEEVSRISEDLGKELSKDQSVSDFVLMRTGSYKVNMSDCQTYNLLIENGDHSKFPVKYSKGSFPKSDREIALSILNAKELGLDIGDSIDVCLKSPDGSSVEKTCMISGIYSDITNGGKTAKASFNPEMDITPVMWSIVYVTLNDESMVQDWTEKFRNAHGSVKESMKVTSIKEYLNGVYGQTISNIGNASVVTSVFVMIVLFVVILLLTRLLIWRERSDSSLKKALGFTSRDVQNEYLNNVFLVSAIGIVVGILAGVFPGQLLAGIFLSSLGAQGFRFIINPVHVFVLVPVISLFTVLAAAWAGLIEIRSIRAFECLR